MSGAKWLPPARNMRTQTVPKQVITANRLADGAVVYMTAAETWSRNVDEARPIEKAEVAAALAAAEHAVKACEVVAPYAIEVEIAGLRVSPVRYREQIRAAGPTQPAAGQTA